MNIELTYQAKNADEFKDLALWMKENGIGSVSPVHVAKPTVSTVQDDKGPNEIAYREKTGKNLRLTMEERESGLSREEIAANRLLELSSGISPKDEEISSPVVVGNVAPDESGNLF